jgi:hypothetical protein
MEQIAQVGRDDGLTLAAINGTIVALVVAAASAYFFIHLQALETMKTDLIDTAHRINDVRLGFSSKAGLPDFESSDRLYLLALVGRSGPLTTRAERLLGLEQFSDLPAARRADIALALMSQIGLNYPFPSWSEKPPLATEGEVRDWLADLWEVLADLQWTVSGPGAEGLREVMQARDDAEAAAMEELQAPLPEMRDLRRRMCEGFVQFVGDAERVYRATSESAERIDRYRARLPSRNAFKAAAAILIGVFLCGVAWPMVNPNVSALVNAWIPAGTYLGCLLAAAWWGSKALR